MNGATANQDEHVAYQAGSEPIDPLLDPSNHQRIPNWILDSGATSHGSSGPREVYASYRARESNDLHIPEAVYTADGHALKVLGMGDMLLRSLGETITVSDVLHIADAARPICA